MKYNNKSYPFLSFFTIAALAFSHSVLAAPTPAGQDTLQIQTDTPKRKGDSLFSYTVEWRVDDGLTYRGTGIIFAQGPDKPNSTTNIEFAKKMASALSDGMEQQYPSWRGVLPEPTPNQPEVTLTNKSGFSFTSITFRDYSNQKLTYGLAGKNFNSANISVAIDLVLSADVDYIEGFKIYESKDKKHEGTIDITIGDGEPVSIKTNDKTTKQLEQEIASALGSAVMSTSPLFPNLSDGDTRNNKPFDGSEVQFANLAANSITIDINDPTLGVLSKFKFKDENKSSEIFGPTTVVLLMGLALAGYFGYTRYQASKNQDETGE